jgi:hypothetical protein
MTLLQSLSFLVIVPRLHVLCHSQSLFPRLMTKSATGRAHLIASVLPPLAHHSMMYVSMIITKMPMSGPLSGVARLSGSEQTRKVPTQR